MNMRAVVEIRSIPASATIPLRQRVMWPDRPPEALILPDDHKALHFGAFLDGDLVGVGSIFPEHDRRSCRLRKLAVATEHQGKGIARLLLAHAFERLRSEGMDDMWCDARVTARGFYEHLGFYCAPEVFQKNGLDYVVARRRL